MTEYEKLSLTLLAVIANGLALQVTQANKTGDLAVEHSKLVLEWQKNVHEALHQVSEAVRPDVK